MEEFGGSRLAEGEREATLTHLLQLERERRLRAEQMVEAEKQACLELHRLLIRERKVHTSYPTSPSQITLVPGIGESEGEGQEDPAKGRTTAFVYPQATTSPAITGQGGWEVPLGVSGSLDSSLLSLGSDFSLSVFNQLPSDLQRMLGVTTTDASLSKPVLIRALEAVKADDPERLQKCLSGPDGGTISTADGQNLLDVACGTGHTGCVRVLLNAGYGPNCSCRDDGMIPVHLAARNGHTASLKLLLENGGNPSYQDHEGQSPLFLALCEGRVDCIDKLLDFGSSLQTVTKSGYTPFHAAVSGNLPEALRSLLVHLRTSLQSSEVNQVVNHQDRDGSTALHLAASRGFKRCVEVLCACAEVDLSLRDRWNRLALDISTDDCRDILTNKDSKEVAVYVEQADTPAVAIGRITILRHHKFPDVEPLVKDVLQQYCNDLRGHATSPWVQTSSQEPPKERDSTSASLFERLKEERLPGSQSSSLDNPFPDVLREAQQKLQKMDLGVASIAGYRIEQLRWVPGELSQSLRVKNLFSVFGGTRMSSSKLGTKGRRMSEISITLKGVSEKCLDRLAFELMIPVARLREYIDLLEKRRALMLHGPQGSGKTLLAKTLAETLKHNRGGDRTQIIQVSLHPSFQRDDLFRLLHINGTLVPTLGGVDLEAERSGERTLSSLQPKYHILILDDTDRVCALTVLAELLTAMEYRGPTNPLWIDAVHGRDGGVLYPAGHYYMQTQCYIIATRTTGSGASLPASASDHFAHVSLELTEEPSTGVLYRQLMARLIHTGEGRLPHCSDQMYRSVQWVWQTWVLYNHYMLHLNLPKLTTGVRHFIQCPLESNDPDRVHSWLCGVWNQQLVPWIEGLLLASSGSANERRQDVVNDLLMATIQRVFRPTCPLDSEGVLELLQRFRGGAEAMAARKAGQRKKNSAQYSPPLRTVSSLTRIPVDRTPPLSSSARPPSMVAYEDMARNSPRMKAKPPSGPGPRRSGTAKSFSSQDQADTASVDRMPLRDGPKRGKSLRKLRTKALNLFSRGGDKEGGTLPRLFRRGSRTSLASVMEQPEEQYKPTRQQRPTKPAHELDNFFDMLSNLSSTRYDDQRSQGPSLTSSPIRSPEPAVVPSISPPSPRLEVKPAVQSNRNGGRVHAHNWPPRGSPLLTKRRTKSADDVLSNGYTSDDTDEIIDDLFQGVSEDDKLSYSPPRNGEVEWQENGSGSLEDERGLDSTLTSDSNTATPQRMPKSRYERGKGVANGYRSAGYEPEASYERRDSDTNSLLFSAGLGFLSSDSPILKGVSTSPSLSKEGSSSRLTGHRPSLTMMDRVNSNDNIHAVAEM